MFVRVSAHHIRQLGRMSHGKAKMEITLTKVEDEICTLLDACTMHLKEQQGLTTSCRIAGGWVRDKLLGLQSNDIDVALTDIMGYSFAQHLADYAKSNNYKVGTVAKIESNPDQSKHLETARITLLDTELDLVNLRSEEYAENSRIPTQVKFGTPLDDALRRDMTINALFYNIHTRQVEDHTGKGLDDLRTGTIRTPLSPKETFQDDPLRVLRCVRFASRYNFEMVDELENAARDPIIQDALRDKISRERVGEELSKMMKARRPLLAVRLIEKLKLYTPVFGSIPRAITGTFSKTPKPSTISVTAAAILEAILEPSLPNNPISLPPVHRMLLEPVATDTGCKARLYLAAALTPFIDITYLDKKSKKHLAVEAVIRESLKTGSQNHFLDGIPPLFAAADLLRNPDLNQSRFQKPSERVAIGLLLRDKVVHCPITGSHWATSLLFSLVQELVPIFNEASGTQHEQAKECIELYNTFTARVETLNLHIAVDAKPILSGHQVAQILGASSTGKWIGQVLAKIAEWQLDHPNEGQESCETWLKNEQLQGRIIVDNDAQPLAKKPRTKR